MKGLSDMKWKEVTLSDVSNYSKERINVNELTLKNYVSTENMLPEKAGKKIATSLPGGSVIKYKCGQTLISNIRPYFKKIWYANMGGGCSADVLAFDISEEVDSKYFYYSLSQDIFFDYVMAGSKGTKMPRGDKQQIMMYSLLLPSILEQKAIADTLSCLDDKIELNNRINKNLEEVAQAIFKSWFVDFEPFQDGEFEDSELGRIPKGWRVGLLDECIDFYNGYSFKSKELLDHEVQECYHVFKMGHIKKGGGLNQDGTKSWAEKSKCRGILKYLLKIGDLLMCMTDMKGNVALLGYTALMNENDKYIVNQRVGLLRVNNTFGINFPYLYILTNSDTFIGNLRGRANSGVQVNLSTSEIKASKLIIAPIEVNTKFNEVVIPIFDKMFEIAMETQTLKRIRNSLLPKLISGEIRIPLEEAIVES